MGLGRVPWIMDLMMNANYPHVPSPNNIQADGIAIGRPNPTQNNRVFDPSPNGTSLPLTYAPRPTPIAQFSESGFDARRGEKAPTTGHPASPMPKPGRASNEQ